MGQWTGLRKTEEGGAKGELIRGQINKERRERESCRFIMISNLNWLLREWNKVGNKSLMKRKEINYKSRETWKKEKKKVERKREKEKKLNLIERGMKSCNETRQQNTTMNTMIIERWMDGGLELK